MSRREVSRRLGRAVDSIGTVSQSYSTRFFRRTLHPTTSRYFSSSTTRYTGQAEITPQPTEKIIAAPPIEFSKDGKDGQGDPKKGQNNLLRRIRVVPASPSYFSAKPDFTDDFISLQALFRKYAILPILPAAEAPRVAWKTVHQYRVMVNEPVKTLRYQRILEILHRLNRIHPSLMPEEVMEAMKRYKKDVQPHENKAKPGTIDQFGRAKGVGRRKTSSAVAWLVEGEGEVLINGKTLAQFFGRLHDRESAVWALKSTQRLDKYNVWGLVKGGGVTGQAEALTLAVAKALLVHEPMLKPALRRGESRIASSSCSVLCCFILFFRSSNRWHC